MATIDFRVDRINQILRDKILQAGGTPAVTDLFRNDAYPILFNQLLGLTGTVAFDIVASSNAVANSNAENAFAPAAVQLAFPAGALNSVGTRVNLKAGGVLATTGTPTFIFRSRLGGVAGSLIGASSALTAANNSTAAGWHHEAGFVVRTAGAAGVLLPDNARSMIIDAASGAGAALVSLGNNGVAAVAAVDLTAAQTLVATVQMSAADPANTTTMTYFSVEVKRVS